jgi:hypothetical protein
MSTTEHVRIEIAFMGGQAVSVLVETSTADALQGALETGHDGAFTIDAEDGRYILPVDRIVYVKRFARESRVGFGAS